MKCDLSVVSSDNRRNISLMTAHGNDVAAVEGAEPRHAPPKLRFVMEIFLETDWKLK